MPHISRPPVPARLSLAGSTAPLACYRVDRQLVVLVGNRKVKRFDSWLNYVITAEVASQAGYAAGIQCPIRPILSHLQRLRSSKCRRIKTVKGIIRVVEVLHQLAGGVDVKPLPTRVDARPQR